MKDIFFVSGLPRSGSTLLVNLLAQHPKVHCTPTSGCHNLLHSVKIAWRQIIEHRADKNASSPDALKNVLKSVLYSYHNTEKSIIFDKSRSWLHDIEMLETLMGRKLKIIVPVRDIAEIVASFECLYRKGTTVYATPGPPNLCQNTEGRVDYWISNVGEVGSAYIRLRDVFTRGLQDRLCLVEYDYLTSNPKKTMELIWDFLEINIPKHNFDNVINQTPENDNVYGYLGLHDIRPNIEPNPKKANIILGDALTAKLQNQEFWRN